MKSKTIFRKTALTLFITLAALLTLTPRVAAQSGPILNVSPDTLRFYVNICWGSSYADSSQLKSFTVANIGTGDMTWTGTAGDAWVAFDPQSGGNFDSVVVWIDWANGPSIIDPPQPGDTLVFESRITVSSPESDNSPQAVVVQLGYTCEEFEYLLTAQPAFFDLAAGVNDTVWSSFHVWEASGASIDFSCANSSDWLHLLPPSPQTTPDSVVFTVISAGLDSGVYYDTIVVTTTAEPSNSPLSISVRLQVGGSDLVLATQPEWFNYTLQEGETGGGDSLLVYETGGRSINFWTNNQSTWLYVDTMGASPLYTPGLLYVNVSAVGLAPGIYSDSIEIMSDEAVNSPLLVPVTLTVEGEPESAINTIPVYFDIDLDSGQTTAEPLQIYETGGQAVEFSMETQASWLGITAEPPYITPTEVTVNVSAVNLPPGFYVDTIFITPTSDNTVNPAAVAVYLQVSSNVPRLISVPAYFQFTLYEGDSLLNTGLWVYEASGDTVPFAAQTMHSSSWLRLTVDTLNTWITPDSVRFGLFTDDLAPGTYADTIILYNPLDSAEAYYETIVPVFLTVQGESPQNGLAANPPAFFFEIPMEWSAIDTLSVYEINGDTVSFFYSYDAPWLAVNPFGMPPYMTPMTMPISVTSWGLAPGTYVDTIFIGRAFDSIKSGMTAVPVTMIVDGINFVWGDVNGDQSVDLADAIELVNYIFKNGPEPDPLEAADANCDARINVGDIVFIVSYVFRNGPEPGCF
jgi:hypothetical protein